MIRVLSAIVVPPHMSVSGGARAGEFLSGALAGRCLMTVANMMGDHGAVSAGIRRLDVRTRLPPGLPWSRLPNRYSTLFYRSDIPTAIRSGRYDLVHLHNPMPALELARIARACVKAGLPYVISTHGFNEVANGAKIYRFDAARRLIWRQLVQAPVARAVRGASAIFALSPADFSIVREMGFQGEALSVVPNGVALPKPGDPARDLEICQRLGLPARKAGNQPTFMFLANHTPNKGLPVLLEAFKDLDQPYLLIVGGETRSEVDYEAYARSTKPGQQIVVTGRLTDEEVGVLMRRSDLFVFPTLADTLPLVVFEAMSHGLPVLASSVGGIPHQIDDACGLLVPPGDVKALTAAVAALAANPQRLVQMGENARVRVRKSFTWEAAAEKAYEGYKQVLAHRAASLSTRAISHQRLA